MKKPKIAVVGSTGLVGQQMLKLLFERKVPFGELLCVASSRSVGTTISQGGRSFSVISVEEALAQKPDIALFSAGGGTSLKYAPEFAKLGTVVIDNSSAWRMNPKCPLVVPEVNRSVITKEDKIISNPNCSTIQMVVALHPLHQKYQIKRVVVSTYQSVTGAGQKGVEQLKQERKGKKYDELEASEQAFSQAIDLNALPHIDVFQPNGYTKEEMKMVNETKKILNDESIALTATAVRIPTIGGHSESINIEFAKEYDLAEVRSLLQAHCTVVDDVENLVYPTPIAAHEKDDVFVGRLRRDESRENCLNMWVVSDNLRKGAATNAVQIAEYVIEHIL